MKKIAVIGFGRFGQLITSLLLTHTSLDVLVISSKPQSHLDRVTFGRWEDLANVEAAIIAVPISAFEETIKKAAQHLSPTALCIDVCSVKSYPVKVMLDHMPATMSILAAHPMFGPDSFQKNQGIQGFNLIMYPVRIDVEVYQQIVSFCQKSGLQVHELTPSDHDRYAAYSQLYTFCIGQLTHRLQLATTPIDTYWYAFFLEQSTAVTNDGSQLFKDIFTYNPFAKEFLFSLKKSFSELVSELEST